MIQNTLQFKGNMVEDSNKHLKRFLQLCNTFKYNRVSNDAIHLRLFSISLCDNTTDWLDSLELGSITTWNDLAEKIHLKFFPISRTIQLLRDITNFKQYEGESLSEA
ncbi:oligopeptide transporter 4-like [Gossypium australe]|uniref:Oligopeptide transporter 4-like n=1 Tax=Gossypium australe TaxID=47621 RepID=A0A5B6VP18_9ROSI|nr:oligopeptide transporter 4-like [Gossypium australe]